jgi:sialate O-acetylesterase
MIAPLTPYAIRGVIWYQGENEAVIRRSYMYRRLFRAMIEDWRRAWGLGDFPFLFVQLANFAKHPQGQWPELREAQTMALELRNTGMAVTVDIGDPNDIHPKNKQDVGLRLGLAARAIAYKQKVAYSGPMYRQLSREGNALRVWFDSTGGGLVAKGGELKSFEIAGADGKFVAAQARIDKDTVLVSSPEIAAPVAVRYGWADSPECNLYNGEGLPASPFRTNRWTDPLVYR